VDTSLTVDRSTAPNLEELRAFTARLRGVSAGGNAALGIDLLDAIEALKSVGAAAQAVVTDDVATSIRADRKGRGLPRVEWDRGIGAQIALLEGNPPTVAAGTSGSPEPWSTRCRTRWHCCSGGA
jgi:hypothetical protein